jgi:adenylylsulfate kinase
MAQNKPVRKAKIRRSLVKAITYRIFIIILDFVTIYIMTGQVKVALGFMLISNIYTSVAYYLHERIWNKIDWGR